MITQKNRITLFVAFFCLLQEVLGCEKGHIEHVPHDEEIVTLNKKVYVR